MSQKKYKVVEANWVNGRRVEIDIGSPWKPEKAAKDDLRNLAKRHPTKTFSLAKLK